jgi:RNA polymerase sigma factor (sigma-70 family)
MATARPASLLHHLGRLAASCGPAAPADRELVRRFAERADAEAFAVLLARHGPMVLRVCRRVLPNAHDAEDALQATFLVLARKAGCLRRQESVGSWLYGVAYRVALNARAAAARRAAHEARAPLPAAVRDPLSEVSLREAQALLDEELARLPERYRAPLVLCCLEGLARDEAARQLGWSAGTLKSRLERGRALLRARLARRGLALPAAFAAAFMGHTLVRGELPAALTRNTLQSVLGGVKSEEARALAGGVLHAMSAARLKAGAALLLAAALLTVGVGLLAVPAMPPERPGSQPPAAARAPEPKEMPVASPRLDRYGDPLPKEAIARLGTTRLRQGDGAFFLRFTPDGKRLVSQGNNGVCVWDATTAKELRFIPWEAERLIEANISLSADGKRLAMPAKSGIGL